MNKCPHCQFLVRDETRTCDVCNKPLARDAAVPAFAAGQRPADEVFAARVGPVEAGFPVSLLWLCLVGVLLAAAVVVSSTQWM